MKLGFSHIFLKMKQHSLICIFLLLSIYCIGQIDDRSNYHDNYLDTVFVRYDTSGFNHNLKYKIDTIIFQNFMSRFILIGTTIIPYSENRFSLSPFGLELTKVTKSDCKEDVTEEEEMSNQINSIISTDSTLIIDINIYENCCFEFLCDAKVDKAGVLDLTYICYGPTCFCDCCFGLTFHLKIWDWEPKNFQKIKSVLINGDSNTEKIIKNE